MGSKVDSSYELLIRYRELLALSYEQKEAIQKGDFAKVASILAARDALIAGIRQVAEQAAAALPDDDEQEMTHRLTTEIAMLLGKIVSLDRENERLLQVKAGDDQRQ